MQNPVVTEELEPGSDLLEIKSSFSLGDTAPSDRNLLQGFELSQLEDQEHKVWVLHSFDKLDDVLMSLDRELLMKFGFQVNFLPLLLIVQQLLVDGFQSKLLATDGVGEEINSGEGSFTQRFSSLVALRNGIGGSVSQDFWRLDVSGS